MTRLAIAAIVTIAAFSSTAVQKTDPHSQTNMRGADQKTGDSPAVTKR